MRSMRSRPVSAFTGTRRVHWLETRDVPKPPAKETPMRLSVSAKSFICIPAAFLAASCGPDLSTSPARDDVDISFAKQGATASYSSSTINLLPGDFENRANGVNDAGEVVGYSNGGTGFHAFVTLGGAVTQLAGTGGNAHAISNGATRYVAGQTASTATRWTIIGNS